MTFMIQTTQLETQTIFWLTFKANDIEIVD